MSNCDTEDVLRAEHRDRARARLWSRCLLDRDHVVIVIPCGFEIVVMSVHRCASQGKKGVLGLFVSVRMMIEGHVQTHDKSACPGGQPKGQDRGGEDPLS